MASAFGKTIDLVKFRQKLNEKIPTPKKFEKFGNVTMKNV